MQSATLRVIDLGRCSAQDYFAASDVPALSSDDTPILVFGVITEENITLGFNRQWATTMTELPAAFTRARLTSAGGAMYCRNVGIMRIWVPRPLAEPFDLESILTTSVVDELVARVDRDLPIHYETKYACLAGQKFAGGSHNLINGRSSGMVAINMGPTDFASVRPLFRKKQLLAVRDLSEFNLPGSFCDGIIDRVAASGECHAIPSRWTTEEAEHLAVLQSAHADLKWIDDEARLDLFEFRRFYGDDIYG
jgi:hypothetical protein